MITVTEPENPGFAEWAIVELMGHRLLAGYLTECEIAGKGFLRLDIPADDTNPAATQLYNPGSVYAITPTSEDMARKVAATRRPAPVSRWELERATTPTRPSHVDAADGDGDGDDEDGGPWG